VQAKRVTGHPYTVFNWDSIPKAPEVLNVFFQMGMLSHSLYRDVPTIPATFLAGLADSLHSSRLAGPHTLFPCHLNVTIC